MHLDNQERIKEFHESIGLFSNEETEIDKDSDPLYLALVELNELREPDIQKKRSQSLIFLRKKIIKNYESMKSDIEVVDNFLDKEFNKLEVELSGVSPE